VGKKVVVIGAGVAGLSAGIHLQRNGYDVEIVEREPFHGGLCCAWDRKGFAVDGCIHWLVGSNPEHQFYKLWNEIVDMPSIKFIDFDTFTIVEDKQGNQLNIYTDADRLLQEMLEKAPEDEKHIRQFIKAIKKLARFKLPVGKPPQAYTLMEGVRLIFSMTPFLATLGKWSKISVGEFSDRLSSPLMKSMMLSLFSREKSILFYILTLAWMYNKDAGYPVGGSRMFAGRIAETYKKGGGTLTYSDGVKQIFVEQNRAVGVELESGRKIDADIVISAADGHTTIYKMLGGKFRDETIDGYYENRVTFPSYIQLSLGVDGEIDELPHSLAIPVDEEIDPESGAKGDFVLMRKHDFDPTLAPKGKSLITLFLTTREHEYWQKLKRDGNGDYKKAKDRVANELIAFFERKVGPIKDKIVMTDIVTPSTVIRYTGNWKGSFEGWMITPDIGLKQMKQTLPGLDNFYMAGHWVQAGGGLPSALMSGRKAAQLICLEDGVLFKSD